jgi:chromate transporter
VATDLGAVGGNASEHRADLVVAAVKADSLGSLAAHFALLSLFAIGGVNAVIPEMHRQAVEVAGWASDRQFAEMFAIAQVAPGPNVMVVVFIGYHVAGIAGALTALTAMCGPSCLLTFLASRAWQRFQYARWRIVVQAALLPISAGLIGASALVLARASDHNLNAVVLTTATVAVSYFTRFNPLWMFALAALVGYAGLV